ncbi:proteasome subunit alpha type-6 isoform X2 [Brachypodium distachyon]|uniref:Proteasome alpha-type subunits domain-containing protein n=1 Tax=Brachypodium distachyon TaxID=15368 RepID=I1GSE6_BRADI|nr:proteasome subunit alpha type-6 isoform X2 [Brachypodium distachyon]KQK15274.1 hypothetical protein BRADI_1g21570v3 [Brachypodium distachyon]|eukprot:XP_010235676.1 proteasome subunit alpha type-6 isoform X2 [Brachypodium distachyon]
MSSAGGGGVLGVGASSSRGGGTARKGPGHDRRITVFSPEGRLYQLEYAFNAVKLAGITSVAVRGVDSVTVFTQHDKDPIDPLLDRTDPVFSRVFAITERLGIVATGMAADGRALVHEARNQAAEFRFKWGYEIPPRVLAQWIADRAQIRTQHAGMRPYGVVAMIFGIDGEKGTLFTCDPAGICLGCKAASAGLKDSEAIKYLEEKMSGNPSLSFEATSEMAAFALRHVLGDINSLDIEVGSVEKEEPVLRVFLPAAGQEKHRG